MQPNIVMCSKVLRLGCRVETVAAGMLCEHKFRRGFVGSIVFPAGVQC